MTEPIDELYARWQANPDVLQTAALCDALARSNRADLVEIVGSHAARQLDVRALLAAARMYAGIGRLDDAQSVLVAAGRLAPRDGEVYRWLGEVLLRRGDAERAEKVLERAVQFGAGDAAAGTLLGRARALTATQRASGMTAVAEQIALELNGHGGHGGHAAPPAARSKSDPDDAETQIRKGNEVRAALASANFRAAPPVPAAGRPAPLPPPVPPPAPPPLAAPPPAQAPEPFSFGSEDAPLGAPQTAGVALPPASAAGAAMPASLGTAPFAPSPSSARMPAAPPAQAQGAPPIPVNPLLVPQRPAPADGRRVPEPRDVLEALQIAGVYEPDGAVRPVEWDKPAAGKKRFASYAILIGFAVLLVGGGTGTYFYVKSVRAKQHLEAEAVLAKVDADLRAGDPKLLGPSEEAIGRAFDLESRSEHAALTWLHERVMKGLLEGGENLAFEDATQRAKEVGIEERRVAFAYVASFLFQGDTAGAAATLAKWDDKAGDDAFYQLVAGATFERAGDPRALERYAAASRLDPELFIARVLLARATAVDGDPHEAAQLAKELRDKHPGRAEPVALVALAWARDPMRGDAPAEVKDVVDKADLLPSPLKAVPHAARAILALEGHDLEQAKPALQKGLALSDTPGVASWLGSIALATGDEALARKAALAAVSYSAVYPPARVLAARVALLGARLDEALKAAEDLPPTSPDVAVVTAAVAYEKLDGERMTRSFEPLPEDAKKLPFAQPLLHGASLMSGSLPAVAADKLIDMADDEAPWADLVAMDQALDSGDLETAAKIAALWKDEARPLRAVRLARLARYGGKLEDADRLSRAALEGGTVTIRSLAERVFTLVAAGKAADAIALFKSYPNVGGPLAKWLRAYATASAGKNDEARAIVSQEDPPPALAPMPARVIAAAAYAAMKDTRHGNEYTKPIVQAGFASPDVTWAAERLGVRAARRR